MNWDKLNLEIALREIDKLKSDVMRKRTYIKNLGMRSTDWEIMDESLSKAYSDLNVITRTYEMTKD